MSSRASRSTPARPFASEAVTMLRDCWELEATYYWLRVAFRRYFGLRVFSVTEFEDCLVDHENLLLSEIHTKLLCSLLNRVDIIITTWPKVLWQLMRERRPDWSLVREYSLGTDAGGDADDGDDKNVPLYETMDVVTRIRLLHALTEVVEREAQRPGKKRRGGGGYMVPDVGCWPLGV